MSTQKPTLFTVCAVATAADAPRARELSLEWVKSLHPFAKQTVSEMLPTPLSPTGAAPVTLWLCAMTISQAHFEHMQAFIVSHAVPVTAETAGQQEDGTANKVANRDKWLAAKGLKVVT